ncbi:MAG TPA: response regulator [Alphaproteobacteria bacterium]
MSARPGGSTAGGSDSSTAGRERSRSVLIVEDEALVAMFIADLLEALDYAVCGIAASGAHALELAELHRPRAAIVDIGLKGAIDGVETAAQLRERFGTKCLLCSGDVGAATEARAARAAPVAILPKPFTSAQLEAALVRTLAATG